MLIPVKDSTSLKRNMEGGHVINDDSLSLNNYIQMRQQKIAESERLNKLESDMSEIKSMLQQLLGNTKCQ